LRINTSSPDAIDPTLEPVSRVTSTLDSFIESTNRPRQQLIVGQRATKPARKKLLVFQPCLLELNRPDLPNHAYWVNGVVHKYWGTLPGDLRTNMFDCHLASSPGCITIS
jgi:hypothetical protein